MIIINDRVKERHRQRERQTGRGVEEKITNKEEESTYKYI